MLYVSSFSTLAGKFWGGRLDGVSGTLGSPLERRVSLMLVTMQISAVCVYRALLRRLLEGWAFAVVSYTAATTLPPSRRCLLNGALLDWLLLITGLAPILETFASRTLRKALRYGRNPEWRWRLLRVHCTGGLARFVRFGRGKM